MDKAEYQNRLEELTVCVQMRDFKRAYAIVQGIDWRRVKSIRTLNMVADVYEINKDYEACTDVLKIALSRSSIGKSTLYRLVELYLKQGNIEEAEKYFGEYCEVARKDNNRILLEYMISKAKGDPVEKQIDLLEQYKDIEYTEKWAYELALLYSEAGDTNKCVENCDDLILWFSEGKYVLKAMELKMRYRPLSASQRVYFDKEQRDFSVGSMQKPAVDEPVEDFGSDEPLESFDITEEDIKRPAGRAAAEGLEVDTDVLPVVPVVDMSYVEETEAPKPAKKETEAPKQTKKEKEYQKPLKSEPVYSEPVNPEPAYSEPVNPEPAYSEPVKPQPAYNEPIETAALFNEPVKPEPVYSEPVKPQPAYNEPIETAALFNEPVKQEPVYQEPAEEFVPKQEAPKQAQYKQEPAPAQKQEKQAAAPKKRAYVYDEREIPDPEPTAEERMTHTIPLAKVGENTVPISIEDVMRNETPEERRIRILNKANPTKMSDRQRQIFTYFARIPGMDTQILQTISGVYAHAGEHTSKNGNIAIMGTPGCGKTRLSQGLVVAMSQDMGLTAAKTARLSGEDMNSRDAARVVSKMAGGFLVIEHVSDMNDHAVECLSKAMEFKTDRMILIIEDEKTAMRAFLNKHPDFAKKIEKVISVPAFTNDELVTFARTYCAENSCQMDDLGVLALYTIISSNQSEDQPMTITNVRDIIDNAMLKARRSGRHTKRTGAAGKITILYEKDFN